MELGGEGDGLLLLPGAGAAESGGPSNACTCAPVCRLPGQVDHLIPPRSHGRSTTVTSRSAQQEG